MCWQALCRGLCWRVCHSWRGQLPYLMKKGAVGGKHEIVGERFEENEQWFFFFFLLVRKPFSCSECKWLTDQTIQTRGSQRMQSSAPCLLTRSFTDPALTLQGGRFGSQTDCSSLLFFWLADLLAFLFHCCGLFDMYFSSPLSHKLDFMKFFGVWVILLFSSRSDCISVLLGRSSLESTLSPPK